MVFGLRLIRYQSLLKILLFEKIQEEFKANKPE